MTTNLSDYIDAWAMARAFEQAALVIFATDPVQALRLAMMVSEVRAVRP